MIDTAMMFLNEHYEKYAHSNASASAYETCRRRNPCRRFGGGNRIFWIRIIM